MERVRPAQPFHGLHRVAVGAQGQGQAGTDRPAIDQDRASPALPGLAAVLHAPEPFAPEQVQQGGARLALGVARLAVDRQVHAAGREVGDRGGRPLGERGPQPRDLDGGRGPGALDGAAQGPQRQRPGHRPAIGGCGVGVLAEGRAGRGLLRAPREVALPARRALHPRLRLEHARRRGLEAGEGHAGPRAMVARERDGHGHAQDRRRRGKHGQALERCALGHPGYEQGDDQASAGEVGAGVLEEAQAGYLEGAARLADHEHGVQREQRRHHLGIARVVDRLAAEGGHAADHARGRLRAAGRGEQAAGGRVGRPGVDHVLEGDHGAEHEVAVLHLDAVQAQRGEVQDVGDLDVGGQQPRATAERHHPLGGQGQRVLDPRGTVVATDASRQHGERPF